MIDRFFFLSGKDDRSIHLALTNLEVQPSWLGEGTTLTAAGAAALSANLHGALWCSAAEAAAAALALLLPDSRRRSRRALAYAALAATAATHLMWARAITLFLTAADSFSAGCGSSAPWTCPSLRRATPSASWPSWAD
jgi:hypothetical protein